MSQKIEKYTGMVIQPAVTVAKNRADIQKNLNRVCKLIDFGVGYFWERPVRLIVLPEYFLQGVTTPGKGEAGLKEFMDKAITIPGPEMDMLAEKAREYNLFISGGGVIELLPEFPDRWFNTAFIIGPSGEVILKYHKWHIPASIGMGTSPHDMLDDYTKVFGNNIRQRFPVVDTEIGKLGTMTCHDGATPEVSRALAFNGVEVICHPTAMQEVEGTSQPWDFWTFTRRTRAHDNMCYLLGSNWGTVEHEYYPKGFCPGHSLIVDYTGMVLRQAPYPEEQVITTTIDIEALREHRTIINHNMWIDLRTEGFREIYEHSVYPPNRFPAGHPPKTQADKIETTKAVMDNLYGRGQFVPPHGILPEEMSQVLEERIKRAQSIGALRRDED